MNFSYNKQVAALIAAVAIAGSACGQQTKVKTITIINGDTTINESNWDDKSLSQMEKEMNISICDGGKSEKTIVKKIIINGDADDKNAEAMAYAYGFGDEKNGGIEVTTEEDGSTKIIIKKDDNKEDGKEDVKEKKTVKKSVSTDPSKKESMNLNINITNTTAKIEVETGSKEPMNISILDESGKQVFYDSQKSGGKYSKEIPLGKKGTYFLNIIQDKKVTNEKIVIE